MLFFFGAIATHKSLQLLTQEHHLERNSRCAGVISGCNRRSLQGVPLDERSICSLITFQHFLGQKEKSFSKNRKCQYRIFYYTKLVLNIVTFWEILFLRCLSEKCQGFGNELWFFG